MKPVSPSVAYASLLPRLAEAGRDIGYVIAPHGTMARDLDLVAVPWTEEAGSAEAVIMRLLAVTGGHLIDGSSRKEVDGKEVWEEKRGDAPVAKPHGRLAYVIHLDHGLYLDVSVMPRAPADGAAP